MGPIRGCSSKTDVLPVDAGSAKGTWWLDDSGRYLPHDFVPTDLESRRRAFRFLNLVEVEIGPAGIKLRWDTSCVSSSSIIAAAGFLCTQRAETHVTLEFFWGAWNVESLHTPASAMQRMAGLAGYRDVEPYRRTMTMRRPLAGVRDESALIRTAFEAWDSRGVEFSHALDSGLWQVAKFALGFRRDRRDSHLIFDHIGEAACATHVFGRKWAATAFGRECDRSQPDFEFDERVCDVYEEVLKSGEPWLDHIRALIHIDNNDPIWVPYRRLVVPARDRMGAPVVVSICDIRQDVDIPFMPV